MIAVAGRPAPGREQDDDTQDDDDDADEQPRPVKRQTSTAATLGSTTIRVSTATKMWLDRARMDFGAESFDALMLMFRERVEQPAFPGLDLDALASAAAGGEGKGIAAAGMRVASFAALALEDPETGVFFNWQRRPHGPAKRLPEPDADGIVQAGGFLDETTDAGAWVEAPSGCYLTERDGTLPDDVGDAIRAAVRAIAAEKAEKKRGKK